MATANDTEDLLASRRAVYGDIRTNANCQHELKVALSRYADLPATAFERFPPGFIRDKEFARIAHHECIEYILEKIARIMTGPVIHEDNYNDIKGYAELARKIAMGESTAP